MGRKAIEINKTQVKKLADAGCTQEQIADFFGCSARSIRKKFPGFFKRGPKEIRITPDMVRQIESLNSIMCTDEEIATVLDMSLATYKKHKINSEIIA
ncbi:MAG: hypothetical protein ACP5I1_19010, partial [Candidatus Hinthialibacter sp.]